MWVVLIGVGVIHVIGVGVTGVVGLIGVGVIVVGVLSV